MTRLIDINRKNRRLDLLKKDHAGAMRLFDGSTINYGVIREENENLIYFTGKGLREIWSPGLTGVDKINAEQLKQLDENKLIDLGLIAITPLVQIERVIF